jgi:Helix-turn-helix domain
MKGRKPSEHKLKVKDRRYLNQIVADGQVIQRAANRARVLLALDRGERIVDILPWVGMSRMAIWYLWQRYLERGVDAIFDDKRSGRPPVFSLDRTRRN